MTLVIPRENSSMSDNRVERGQVGKSLLKHLRRSKTINVSNFIDGKPGHEVSFHDESTGQRSPSPIPHPTSSCQALRHAVSALTRIDDFILEELGDGFFANVYKATHRVTGEEMVMKINKDVANRPSALREVQLMNKLCHPNILRFLGVCVHEGQLHALTEYISGGTLEELLANKNEELPWTLRIKLSLDIAKGMQYLHMEGVFHRDLTSKNVLIKKKENRNYQAVIADFGLATKIPDPKAKEPLPAVGCPWWMAPEVIHGKFYDERADLFSYGIILLEMTARIEADPESMPRTQKFGVDYVKVCEMVDYCPLDFLQLAFKCCQILPEKRPSLSVIISSLEMIYKNLRSQAIGSSGRLHKRSRSEDNIIQCSDSLTNLLVEEVLITPQIIAQVMSKDDPHYCPANANPFANISKFKDGHKVMEFPRQRLCSAGSNGFGSSNKLMDSLTASQIASSKETKRESQSLPSSPIMLRKAAEKLHQASLHGSDAVQTVSRHELRFNSTSSDTPESGDNTEAADKRHRFGCNRTRSLGSLDFFSPLSGPGAMNNLKRKQQMSKHSERTGYGNRFAAGIRESSVEDQLESDTSDTSECLADVESLNSESDMNGNNSLASATYHSLYNDEDETSGAPFGSCDESVSSCSLSSYLSCGEGPEGDSTIENIEDSSLPQQDGARRRQPLSERRCVMNHDVSRPQIADESGSYECNYFRKENCGESNHGNTNSNTHK